MTSNAEPMSDEAFETQWLRVAQPVLPPDPSKGEFSDEWQAWLRHVQGLYADHANHRARVRELEAERDDLRRQVEAARAALVPARESHTQRSLASRIRRALAVLAPQAGEVGS